MVFTSSGCSWKSLASWCLPQTQWWSHDGTQPRTLQKKRKLIRTDSELISISFSYPRSSPYGHQTHVSSNFCVRGPLSALPILYFTIFREEHGASIRIFLLSLRKKSKIFPLPPPYILKTGRSHLGQQVAFETIRGIVDFWPDLFHGKGWL